MRTLGLEVKGAPHAGTGRKITDKESVPMNDTILKLLTKFQGLRNGEEGQDLVEYSLLIALIALVCISGVNHIATAVNGVFNTISSSLG